MNNIRIADWPHDSEGRALELKAPKNFGCFQDPTDPRLICQLPWLFNGFYIAVEGTYLVAINAPGFADALPEGINDATRQVLRDFLGERPVNWHIGQFPFESLRSLCGHIDMPAKCPDCDGEGFFGKCKSCNGDGEWECRCDGCGDEHTAICSTCEGDGKGECERCHGAGRINLPNYLNGVRVVMIAGRPFNIQILGICLASVEGARADVCVGLGGQDNNTLFIESPGEWRIVMMARRELNRGETVIDIPLDLQSAFAYPFDEKTES